MAQFGIQIHRKSKTKINGNGKKIVVARDKKKYEIGNYFSATKLYEKNVTKEMKERGGKRKKILKRAGFVNLLTKKGYEKVQIKGVVESKDNRNFARQNILTKGTIINTELGKAVIINRPGREGNINAKLLE
ncbi:MAG: 30S ribosomal protein S8e [Candidatus Marsarchaeota archaeon]|jgi:Ribosomal protein S8E|nr:30S ribosomal protein S8e [Candidatus Marsarchaeota archaeon]MCL5094709.1 30S ribosomal protein S8e [Candidatus Marsarchaeota archaeon]